MRGKLIIIEGTDCSGKETQAKKLVERLQKEENKVFYYSFPHYDSPTGQIIGGPYLGKSDICKSWFSEGACNVDSLVSSAYYAADRRYNIKNILKHLNDGDTVIVNRYVESNMAHQGGKLKTKEEREKLFKKIDLLEFEIMELPRPDAVLFLYMPYEYACILKKARNKVMDDHEKNEEHLKAAEATYLELCDLYNFIKIDCVSNDTIKNIDEINDEIYNITIDIIKKGEVNEY